MAPIRSILASKAVTTGLLVIACLFLFSSFFDINLEFLNKPPTYADFIDDSLDLSIERKGAAVDRERAFEGRPARSTKLILEKAEVYYQRIIRQRELWLRKEHYGQKNFNPWKNLYWWWYFPASFSCPHDIQRVGPLSDGGKWLCGLSLYEEKPRSKCVIYSFGVNHETRFEGEMLDRTECEIFAYDASVSRMGPETQGRAKAHFKPYFVGDRDYVDKNGIQWKTLRTLMKENGHEWIDILKVDIEGSEYSTFKAMMEDFDTLPFSQLQIELHVDRASINFEQFLEWWQFLEYKGLRPFWTEVNLYTAIKWNQPWASEYSFLNTVPHPQNILLQDYENPPFIKDYNLSVTRYSPSITMNQHNYLPEIVTRMQSADGNTKAGPGSFSDENGEEFEDEDIMSLLSSIRPVPETMKLSSRRSG
ncbi:hypothetical protein BGZ83_012136 [Gryganskiella cystojenkinii]|nr:hypothetical protein BGZ83_012136 [Gryganskiella cystojenkinii]